MHLATVMDVLLALDVSRIKSRANASISQCRPFEFNCAIMTLHLLVRLAEKARRVPKIRERRPWVVWRTFK